MKKLFTFVLFIGLLVTLVLGYLGAIPFVSSLMGTNNPRDLGVVYSSKDHASALEKSHVVSKTLDAQDTQSIVYEGSHEVKALFTEAEVTAHADSQDWQDYPISQVQIRINDDNTCEMSGIIDLAKIDGLLSALDISYGDYKKVLESVHIPVAKMPFYAKGDGSITNNQISVNITAFEVGRFSVPKGLVDTYSPMIVSFGETIISRISGLTINQARFENGNIYFDGTLPNSESAKR